MCVCVCVSVCVCVCIYDSLCHSVEINTTLQSNYTPIKINFKKLNENNTSKGKRHMGQGPKETRL